MLPIFCLITTKSMKRLEEKYNIPSEIVDIWLKEEGEELLAIQLRAIEDYELLNGNNLLITAPSSSGKTFVAEIASVNAWLNHKKVIFLVPMKAIAEEKYADFRIKYNNYGLKVVISTHDRIEDDDNILNGYFDIAVVIFEKMNSLLTQNTSLLNSCGLVIIDEIQLINDHNRGSTLEILLTKIKLIKEKDPDSFQFLGLSAVLGNLNKFDKWLGATHLTENKRPIELYEGIHTLDGTVKFKLFNKGKTHEESINPSLKELSHKTFKINSTEEDDFINERLALLCKYYLSKNKKLLIFRKWKNKTRETATFLSKKLKMNSANYVISELSNIENSNSRESLIECLANGLAFHNSDLSVYERLAIENEFRKKDGEIKIICCTSTLAMGVNLPASVVIIADLMKPDSNSESFHEVPITASEYKNMSGRAGRTKYREEGFSLLLANNFADYTKWWRFYINGKLDQVSAPLRNNDLRKVILNIIGSGLSSSIDEVKSFLLSSYTGFIHWNSNDITKKAFLEAVDKVCLFLTKNKLLSKYKENYKTTALGKLCAISGVEVETFLLLKQAIEKINSNDWHVWEIIFPSLLCKELRVIVKNYIKAYNFMELYSRLDDMNPKNLKQLELWASDLSYNQEEINKREAAFLILYDWIEGLEINKIENNNIRYTNNKFLSGTIRNLSENVAWMIQTFCRIAELQNYPGSFIKELKMLCDRVSRGLPTLAIDIHKTGTKNINRTTAIRLAKNGFDKVDKIIDTPLNMFRGIINPTLAGKIKEELIEKSINNINSQKYSQIYRLERKGFDAGLIYPLYEKEGIELEEAIVDLLNGAKLELGAERITKQNEGEADIRIPLNNYIGMASVTASKSNISDKKCAEIIKSAARFNPMAYIVFGRPNFHSLAINNSLSISSQLDKDKTYKLIRISDLAELYVQLIEDIKTKDEIIELLISSKGFVTI